jgi:septal ring factor EnvC (AmiA/AmiB activator)
MLFQAQERALLTMQEEVAALKVLIQNKDEEMAGLRTRLDQENSRANRLQETLAATEAQLREAVNQICRLTCVCDVGEIAEQHACVTWRNRRGTCACDVGNRTGTCVCDVGNRTGTCACDVGNRTGTCVE